MGNPENKKEFKHVVHLDEKVLNPKDRIGSVPLTGDNSSVSLDGPDSMGVVPVRPNGLQKSIIGKPSIYDLNGNLLASEENLVVITGREFLAQILAVQGPFGDQAINDNPRDYTTFKVTHFGVGDGGSTNECPPTTTGPFDDDQDLGNRVKIGDVSLLDPPKYIANGTLKQIVSDGEVRIVSEEHTINVPTGGQKVIDAYTAIRYRMYLQPEEPVDKPFRFNEAGLYAVEHAWDNTSGQWYPTDNFILFARFTTLDKWLDGGDGVMIEWYVLV